MKRFRILGLALLSLLALGAFAASMASAEEGVLPQQKTAVFHIAGGQALLATLAGESVECKKTAGEGTFLEASNPDQHATGTFTFTECKSAGFPLNTLGDASGTIKAPVLYLICLINSEKLIFGVLIEPKETVHLEVPALKVLILVKGAVIGENTSGLKGIKNEGKEFEFNLAGEKGDQKTALACEINGKKLKHTYEAGIDTKADSDASQTAKAILTFPAAVELMDT